MFNSRYLLPTPEELSIASIERYEESVKKTIIKKCGLININKQWTLNDLLTEIEFPIRVAAKRLLHTKNILLDLYKRPTRTSVWDAYTSFREKLEIPIEDSFGVIFNVPEWCSMVIFHDYWEWGQTAFHGFGCWVRINYNNAPCKFYIETLPNFLERININND